MDETEARRAASAAAHETQRTARARTQHLTAAAMADASRDWVDHMLDTQLAGGALSASASVTAFQQPDLTLSNKKISPSVDPRKTPTPTSQESKRSLSQSNTGGGAADAPAAKPAAAANAPSSVSKSQGRSQSSGPAPSWKTPSVSSIPTQMSEDPAEVAAINTGINKMVTELKGVRALRTPRDAHVVRSNSAALAPMRRRWRRQTLALRISPALPARSAAPPRVRASA